jgi:RecA/RadA recombinase
MKRVRAHTSEFETLKKAIGNPIYCKKMYVSKVYNKQNSIRSLSHSLLAHRSCPYSGKKYTLLDRLTHRLRRLENVAKQTKQMSQTQTQKALLTRLASKTVHEFHPSIWTVLSNNQVVDKIAKKRTINAVAF